MINDYEIILGRGFDEIKLGMSISEIEDILGKPEDIEDYTHENGDESKTFYYYKLGFDLTFESADGFVLSHMSFDGKEFHVKNKITVGKTKDEVLKITQDFNFTEPEIEDIEDEEFPNHEVVSFEDENLNLWFIDGVLDEIQIGPFWEDDDTPIWPE